MTTAVTTHHEVFSRFRRWSGKVPAGSIVDFLGTLSRTEFYKGFADQPCDRLETPSYPPFDEEYFEWIDLLEAVVSSNAQFTMLELGAGWGRWTARGAAAAEQLGIRYSMVAVEAEPTHFEWMEQNLQANGVRMRDCRLIRAAVTSKDGTIGFQVGDAASSYGQSTGGPVEVPAVSLASVLEPHELVDLIDMDVQGAELEILQAAGEPIQRKVRRIHVETHSKELHAGTANFFCAKGWRCHALFEGNTGDRTQFGKINFQDGVQSWLNPSLHTQEELSKVGLFQNSLAHRGLRIGRAIADRLAPVGTARRRLTRAVFSGLAGKFRRDAEDERLRPTGW